MQDHRPRNHFRDAIEAITLLILLGVAIKKFMDWMQKQEKGKKHANNDNDFLAGVMQLISQLQNAHHAQPKHRAIDVTRQVREVRQVARSRQSKSSPARSATKPVAKPARRVSADLNARQQKIYDMIQDQGELTMQSIIRAAGAGVSSRTLRRDMTHLEKIGLISQSGRTKNSVYKLI